jgi:shikimate dehydrogenase
MTGISAEVWGSPIAHSRSPDLHLACYTHLGLPGTYNRRDVTEQSLSQEFSANSETLTGISLTMPLKTGILPLVEDHRGDVTRLHAANTAIKTDGHWWLENTDPLGAAAMLRRLLQNGRSGVVLLGAGATAKSLVLGLHRVSFGGDLTFVVRSAHRATDCHTLATKLGIRASVVELGRVNDVPDAQLIISTLPSGTQLPDTTLQTLVKWGAPLMDVGYHPWPTPLAQAFLSRGLDAHSGLPMLMFQALGQIRAFVNGNAATQLPDEAGALVAMALAVGVDEVWTTPALMGE